jgi:8-oxo-dGTP diphosphatase
MNRYPELPRVAVGAVVFRENRVLLVKRGNPPAEENWAIPGGSVRLGESLQAAAEREIFEETGIVIRAGAPLYIFDFIDRDETKRVRFHYVIVDLAGEYVSGKLQAGDDALAAKWVGSEEFGRMLVSPKTIELLESQYGFFSSDGERRPGRGSGSNPVG